MFHFASAVFWFLIQPLNLAMMLVVISVVLTLAGWWRLSITAGISSFLILFLSGWTTLGALLLHPLENRFERPDPAPQNVDGIIVLGGGLEGAVNLARGGHELNDSGDRFVEAAILARRYPDAKVLISGGQGAFFLKGEGDADTAPRLLEALGVEPSRLLLEGSSRDTYENALRSKEMVEPRPDQSWLLVTSAFHMPRAVGVFRETGFAVIAWPVDYKTAGTEQPGFAEDNALDSVRNVSVGIREWIGLAAYYLAGRTETLFPPPHGTR